MPSRPFCLLPSTFPDSDATIFDCRSGRHTHLSFTELREMKDCGLIQTNPDNTIAWVREPDRSRRERGVVRLARRLSLRGLSARLGEELATAICRREAWARVMAAEIHLDRRPMETPA